ncbi:MAG: response regulator transcription factor [Eubacteriales bacterium]|nr:response regulator transcription factor [Eubacteriales bacterium]
MKILLLTEDSLFSNQIINLLSPVNYQLKIYGREKFFTAVQSDSYDLILLDEMVGDVSGCHIAMSLRDSVIPTPIVMFLSVSSPDDRIQCLHCGVDYLLNKMFDPRELFAYLEFIQKKSHFLDKKQVFGNTTLDTSNATLIQGISEVSLSKKELQLLQLLFQSGHCPVSKSSMLARVWGADSCACDNNVEVYIGFLRKKLHQVQSNIQIHSTRGLGYHLELTN